MALHKTSPMLESYLINSTANNKQTQELAKAISCNQPNCSNSATNGLYCLNHQQRLCHVHNCFLKATASSPYCTAHEGECTRICEDPDCQRRILNEENSAYCFVHRTSGTNKRKLAYANGEIPSQDTSKVNFSGTNVAVNSDWSYIENVFLVGVVFEYFLIHGDITNNWEPIKSSYDLAFKRYIALNPTAQGDLSKIFPRSKASLESQFKALIANNFTGAVVVVAQLKCDWELKYNTNQSLVDLGQAVTTEQTLMAFYSVAGGWSFVEDVFLIAAVVDKFLKSGNADGEDFTSVKETYDFYQCTYSAYNAFLGANQGFIPRTVASLFERYVTIRQRELVGFFYSQWKNSFQSVIFVTLLQLQNSGFNSRLNMFLSSMPSQVGFTGQFGASAAQPAKIVPENKKEGANNLLHLLEAAKAESELYQDLPPKKIRRKSKVDTDTSSSRNQKLKDEEESSKEKRNRWKEEDELSLWRGIAEHGNCWSAISQAYLPIRTHHQVKDKGKRLLRGEGWITGRSRESSSQACERAKKIARRVLKQREANKMGSNKKHPGPKPNMESQNIPKVYPVVTPLKFFSVDSHNESDGSTWNSGPVEA